MFNISPPVMTIMQHDVQHVLIDFRDFRSYAHCVSDDF